MDLVTWLISAAIVLFIDVAAGWWKRQQNKNAELERRGMQRQSEIESKDELGVPYEEAYRTASHTASRSVSRSKQEYSLSQSEDSRYVEGADALESVTPLDIQTYDEEARRPVGRRVNVREIEGYDVMVPGEEEPRTLITHDPVVRKPVVRDVVAQHAKPRQTVVRESAMSDTTPRKSANVSRLRVQSETPSVVRRSARQALTLNPKTVREAIVWMEVLGPPKGMQF